MILEGASLVGLFQLGLGGIRRNLRRPSANLLRASLTRGRKCTYAEDLVELGLGDHLGVVERLPTTDVRYLAVTGR